MLKTIENHPARSGFKVVLSSILISLLLCVLKALVGFVGNSYALIADAIESLTDVLSSVVVIIGLKMALLKADKNHPYGHGKAEPIAAVLVSIFMFFAAVIICVQAISNISLPQETPSLFTLVVLAAIIIVKELTYRNLKRFSEKSNSLSIEADAKHHRMDAVSSFSAFVGISVALFFGEGYESADDWAAFGSAAIIFYNAFLVFKPAFDEIMDVAPSDEFINRVRTIASNVDGVVMVEKCMVRKMGFDYYVDIHVVVDGNISVAKGHTIGHLVKNKLLSEVSLIKDVLTHIEPSSEH